MSDRTATCKCPNLLCACDHQKPAGEHHTGTLNLTGQGNTPSSPITDEMADAALTIIARGVPCPDPCSYQTHQRAEMRAALEAAYPAIRQQVADEIAVTLDGFAADPHGTNGEQASGAFSMAAGLAREIGRKA